ncbi:MAG: L-lactate dehydrogenase [Acidobacteriota bacterium]
MKTTIGIIGMGWVGTSIAISVLHSGSAKTLLLNDVRSEVAEGEAMDLRHGAAFYPSADVRTADIEAMRDADVVVVAAGRGGGPGETRLDLLKRNAEIVREIGARLAGCRGLVVMVSNPVDVLTRVMVEAAGLPPQRVIGTGTMLETARLREMVGREMSIDPRSIHAQVLGEHGDSCVPLWSGAHIGGRPLRDWPGWLPEHERRLGAEVREAAYEIIRRKGATNHAIGLVTATLIRWALRGRRVLTISRVQPAEMGPELAGVALSMPTIVSPEGADTALRPAMDDAEEAALRRSAGVLRDAWQSLDAG